MAVPIKVKNIQLVRLTQWLNQSSTELVCSVPIVDVKIPMQFPIAGSCSVQDAPCTPSVIMVDSFDQKPIAAKNLSSTSSLPSTSKMTNSANRDCSGLEITTRTYSRNDKCTHGVEYGPHYNDSGSPNVCIAVKNPQYIASSCSESKYERLDIWPVTKDTKMIHLLDHSYCIPTPTLLPITNKELRQKSLAKKICAICGKTVTKLRRHVKTHAKELCTSCHMPMNKNHSCSKLGEELRTKGSGKKKFKSPDGKTSCQICDTCGAKFDDAQKLMNHRRTHLYKMCEICGKYVQSQRLKLHLDCAHKRPFKCRRCSRSFGKLLLLREHEYTHSDTPAFVCKLCDDAFDTRAKVTYHLKKSHKIDKNLSAHILLSHTNRTKATNAESSELMRYLTNPDLMPVFSQDNEVVNEVTIELTGFDKDQSEDVDSLTFEEINGEF